MMDSMGKVYGEVLRRHMNAARDDGHFRGERCKRLFELAESLRAEFPEECRAWEKQWRPVDISPTPA